MGDIPIIFGLGTMVSVGIASITTPQFAFGLGLGAVIIGIIRYIA